MSDDGAPSKLLRRVWIAVAIALLLHFGLFGVARRHSGAGPAGGEASPSAPAPTAPPQAVAIDLRRGSDVREGRMSLATELRFAEEQYQPVAVPEFEKPAPLPRERLAFSAALGDGDRGRGGYRFDQLLAPALGALAGRSPGPRPAASSPPSAARAVPRDPLSEAQARASEAAAMAKVPMVRLPPREQLPPPPESLPAPETPDSATGPFFTALTAQLVLANQKALAEALKAGERETVEVRFVVDREGRVSHVEPARPSGTPALDARAVQMIRSAAPLPKPPPDLPQSRLELTFPVQVYR